VTAETSNSSTSRMVRTSTSASWPSEVDTVSVVQSSLTTRKPKLMPVTRRFSTFRVRSRT
jgi:hypothetical protein